MPRDQDRPRTSKLPGVTEEEITASIAVIEAAAKAGDREAVRALRRWRLLAQERELNQWSPGGEPYAQ